MKLNSRGVSDRWEKIPYDQDLVNNALQLAHRDMKTAGDVYNNKDYDWTFSIAYNAMLQAGRALMFSEGFRPKGESKHVSVIEFVKMKFNKKFADKLLFMFNKIRKKRHIAVYEQVNIISKEEVKNALDLSKEFVIKVVTLVK